MRGLWPQRRVFYRQVYLARLVKKEVEGLERAARNPGLEKPSPDVENNHIVDMSSLASMFGFGPGPKPGPLTSTPPTQRPGSKIIGSVAPPTQGGRRTRRIKSRKTRIKTRGKTKGKTRK